MPAKTSPVPASPGRSANGSTAVRPSGAPNDRESAFQNHDAAPFDSFFRRQLQSPRLDFVAAQAGQTAHLAGMWRQDRPGGEELPPLVKFTKPVQTVRVDDQRGKGEVSHGGGRRFRAARREADPAVAGFLLGAVVEHGSQEKAGRFFSAPARPHQQGAVTCQFFLQHRCGVFGDHTHVVRQKKPGGFGNLRREDGIIGCGVATVTRPAPAR